MRKGSCSSAPAKPWPRAPRKAACCPKSSSVAPRSRRYSPQYRSATSGACPAACRNRCAWGHGTAGLSTQPRPPAPRPQPQPQPYLLLHHAAPALRHAPQPARRLRHRPGQRLLVPALLPACQAQPGLSVAPHVEWQQHGHGEARPRALLCPRALCRAPHGCSPGLMALPRAAPRSPAALASSGSAPPGSTCTRSWVRSRTQEPKVSPRAGGRGAGSPLPRYSLSSQARGLTPLGSAGPQGSGRAPGDGAARGGARTGTWAGDALHQGAHQGLPARPAQGPGRLVVGKEALGEVLLVPQRPVQPATARGGQDRGHGAGTPAGCPQPPQDAPGRPRAPPLPRPLTCRRAAAAAPGPGGSPGPRRAPERRSRGRSGGTAAP